MLSPSLIKSAQTVENEQICNTSPPTQVAVLLNPPVVPYLSRSGNVDFNEFIQALEHLGLHTDKVGLPGHGGLPIQVVTGLFARYDIDGSGSISCEEFCAGLMKESKGHKMS